MPDDGEARLELLGKRAGDPICYFIVELLGI
jgi:hypothetical protein